MTHLIVIIRKLGDLSKRLDDNGKTFDQLAITGSDQERADAQQEAEQISLDISNVISDPFHLMTPTETIVRLLKISPNWVNCNRPML